MAAILKELLVSEVLYAEVLQVLDSAGDQFSPMQLNTALHINEEGNIVSVNNEKLTDNSCRQLSYLIGSINFLFNLVNDQVNARLLPNDSQQELTKCKSEIVQLILDLFAGLLEFEAAKNINSLLEHIAERKISIKERLGQSVLGWSLLLFGNTI